MAAVSPTTIAPNDPFDPEVVSDNIELFQDELSAGLYAGGNFAGDYTARTVRKDALVDVGTSSAVGERSLILFFDTAPDNLGDKTNLYVPLSGRFEVPVAGSDVAIHANVSFRRFKFTWAAAATVTIDVTAYIRVDGSPISATRIVRVLTTADAQVGFSINLPAWVSGATAGVHDVDLLLDFTSSSTTAASPPYVAEGLYSGALMTSIAYH